MANQKPLLSEMDNATLLDYVGSRISAMNDSFAAGLETADPATQLSIYKSLALVGPAGLGLAQIATRLMQSPELAKPTPGLKPDQKIGDVGGNENDPQYSGAIDPATLTVGQWAYYQQRNLGHFVGQIFSGRQSGVTAALGKYHAGDLATATPDAGPLAQFG